MHTDGSEPCSYIAEEWQAERAVLQLTYEGLLMLLTL